MDNCIEIVITFILAFITAVLAEPLRRWLFKSSVCLAFKPCIQFGRGCVYFSSTTKPQVMTKYIRVLVECSGRMGITAQGCRPFLSQIERLEPEYKKLHDDPLPLAWAHMGHQPLDIHHGMKFYFDVVAINSDENQLKPQTTVIPETWGALLSVVGKYKFTVIVSGENIAPTSTKVMFQWEGNFNSMIESSFFIDDDHECASGTQS